MLSYTIPQIYTSHSDVELPAKRHFNVYFAPCCDQYMLRKKVWVLFTCGSFDLLLNLQRNNWCSLGLLLIYVYVSNAFLSRKSSAILHGSKFVFLTEWFSDTRSRDVTTMSTRFLQVGASESVTL